MAHQLAPLLPGTVAPDFSLPRSSYAAVSLADLRGRRVVLVFYPANWEPVSQQQLTLYQEYLALFERLGAALLGISADHTWSHGAFARAAGIRYPLLADAHPKGAVSRAYGVYDERAGASARALFVVDARGVIHWSHACPAAINPGVGGILTALGRWAERRPTHDGHNQGMRHVADSGTTHERGDGQ